MRRPSKRRTRRCPRCSTCAEWSAAIDHIIYPTMTGAGAATYRQAVLANNLANISTGGLRAQLSTFRSVPLQGDGAKTRVLALEATSGYDDSAGPVQHTGRNHDALGARPAPVD